MNRLALKRAWLMLAALPFVGILGFYCLSNHSALAARVAKPLEAGYLPVLTPYNQGPAPAAARLLVVTRGPATEANLAQLGNLAVVHGVIARYNIVALTPKGTRQKLALARLPFVARVESDTLRYLNSVGTWDRDIMDVVDVEETGTVGDPDAREVAQTGAGVHVAMIDTGLIKDWRIFLDPARVRTDLARAFMGGGAVAENFVPPGEFNTSNPTNMWERDTNGHGISTSSHIIGFRAGATIVDGVAPAANIIPLKVFPNGEAFTWSSRIIAAFAYVTALKEAGVRPMVVSMSIGGGPNSLERAAIDDAIDSGVIVVTSAGNSGEAGMGWPAAFPEVIGVGATGWTTQFQPGTPMAPNLGYWWKLDAPNDPDGSGTSEEIQSFIADFSSRAILDWGQELDVVAPGYWTVAPGTKGATPGIYYVSGTSFSTPLTAGVAALMMEKNPALTQATVESILKSTALPMASTDSRTGVIDAFTTGTIINPSWDDDCNGKACDAVGAGLVQADAALAATP
jgi:subtilisin family serine protease